MSDYGKQLESALTSFIKDKAETLKNCRSIAIGRDSFMKDEGIAECVLDCTKEIIETDPDFSKIKIEIEDDMVKFENVEINIYLVSPFKITISCSGNSYEKEASERETALCAAFINKSMENYSMYEESEQGLAILLDANCPLCDKVLSAFPSIGVIDNEFVTVTSITLSEPLSESEAEELKRIIDEGYRSEWVDTFKDIISETDAEDFNISLGEYEDMQYMTEEEWNQSQGEGLALQQ